MVVRPWNFLSDAVPTFGSKNQPKRLRIAIVTAEATCSGAGRPLRALEATESDVYK